VLIPELFIESIHVCIRDFCNVEFIELFQKIRTIAFISFIMRVCDKFFNIRFDLFIDADVLRGFLKGIEPVENGLWVVFNLLSSNIVL